MDILEILRIVARRWVFVVPVLIVTGVAAVVIASNTEPTYEAAAITVVKGPNVASTDDAATTAIAPSIIRTIMASPAERAEVQQEAEGADFSVKARGDGTLRVTARSSTDGRVVPAVEAVVDRMSAVVRERSERSGNVSILDVLAEPVQERRSDGSYVASASTSIMPVRASGDAMTSPFYAARMLEASTLDATVRRNIVEPGSGATFEVAQQPRDEAPLLFVTATAPTAKGALRTMDSAVSELRSVLADAQAGTAPGDADDAFLTTLDVVSRPGEASLESTNLLRPLIVIIGLGLMASVSLAVLVDAFARGELRSWGTREPTAGDERVAPVAASTLVSAVSNGSRKARLPGYGGRSVVTSLRDKQAPKDIAG